MTREEIIRNLKYTMEKHKNDTVNTFDTNISAMCKDILDYLEQEPIEVDAAKLQNAYYKGFEDCRKVIRAEIEPKCDRINSLASVLSYTAHREIQELLCEIMDLVEPQESEEG